MTTVLNFVLIISAVLMILAILLQQRGAGLGAGFGSSGELFTTRRGIDKNLFDTTIVLSVIFVGALISGFLIA